MRLITINKFVPKFGPNSVLIKGISSEQTFLRIHSTKTISSRYTDSVTGILL